MQLGGLELWALSTNTGAVTQVDAEWSKGYALSNRDAQLGSHLLMVKNALRLLVDPSKYPQPEENHANNNRKYDKILPAFHSMQLMKFRISCSRSCLPSRRCLDTRTASLGNSLNWKIALVADVSTEMLGG